MLLFSRSFIFMFVCFFCINTEQNMTFDNYCSINAELSHCLLIFFFFLSFVKTAMTQLANNEYVHLYM